MVVGSPTKRATLLPARGVVLAAGDSTAEPLTRRSTQTSQVSAQLRAISLEYTHAELATATLGWNPSRKLGAGCYGAVYRGELKDGSEVAIKAIDLHALMGKGECPEDAGFDEEVQMLSKFRHPHLVTLLGWGQNGLSRYLVYEFLAGGDVFQRLHKSRQPKTDKLFTWHERLSVCLDAATGLSHMHNSTPKAFHRDIKSANILLDRHGTAKMADFGLSCTSGHTGALHITVKTISGTPGYKCPIYERTGRFTEGSEVYSFGMVLLEVLTGLDPSSADPHLPGGIIYPVAETIAPSKPGAIDRCTRNLDTSASWPMQPAHEFGTLALRCVAAHDERSRPHFVEIVKSLRSLLERYPASTPSQPPQPVQPEQRAQTKQPAQPEQRAQTKPAAPAPEPASVDVSHKAKSTFHRAKTFPEAKEAAPAVVAAAPARPGLSVVMKASPTSSPMAGRVSSAEESPFALEVIMATGLDVEALAPELRRMPLIPVASDSPGGCVTVPVGRHCQGNFFEAWLPVVGNRTCISRKACEVSWVPGSDSASLLACGTNPMSVDSRVVLQNTRMSIKHGSELCFTYESKVLLRLRFVKNATTPVSQAPAVVAQAAASPVGASVTAAPAGFAGASISVAPAQGASYVCRAADDKAKERWSVDRTYQLCDGIEEHLPGRAVVLEGVASVGDAVEKLNQGSIQIPSGFCVVYSATKCAYFLLYQPGCQEIAFASLGVAEDAVPGYVPDQQTVQRQVRMASPLKMDGRLHDSSGYPVVRMESSQRHEGASASTSAGSGSGATSSGRAMSSGGGLSVPSVAYRLVCTYAEGNEDVASLPADLREVLLSEGSTLVGRNHQQQNFEAWLPDPNLRFLISRTHCDIVSSGGSLTVTNRSGSENSCCVDQKPLPKGESQVLGAGQRLSFATRIDSSGNRLRHFLVLEVRTAETPVFEDSVHQFPRPLLAQREVRVVCASNMDNTHPLVPKVQAGVKGSPKLAPRELPSFVSPSRHTAAVSSRSRSPEKPRGLGGDAAANAASVAQPLLRRPRVSAGAGLQVSATDEAPRAAANVDDGAAGMPSMILELHGEDVLDVPLAQRTIGFVKNKPLIVGRRHQPELHQLAASEETLQHISREHFCIAHESGQYWVMAMSPTRLWVDRDGEALMSLGRDEMQILHPGDRIALDTAVTNVPEDAVKRFYWQWRKADDAASAGPQHGRQVTSPRRQAAPENPPRWLSVAAVAGSPMQPSLDQTAKQPAPQY